MNIKRINTYCDFRFSPNVLNQHGCFFVDGEPYEVEIVSDHEAVIRGREQAVFSALIEEFRFYSPHITTFYAEDRSIVCKLPPVQLLKISLADIQPSQFYVDREKVAAVSTFLHVGEDIIIQVQKKGDRYISLDGHTRLYCAVQRGWTEVRAVEVASNDYICDFAEEARKRKVHSPYDLLLISHEEYEEKWNRFCEDFFARKDSYEHSTVLG